MMLPWKIFIYFFFLVSCQNFGDQSVITESEKRMTKSKLYMEAHDDGNSFACASCHGLTDEGVVRRAGHPLTNVTLRPNYKNGHISTLREAVNNCRVSWMNAPEWDENDLKWQDLLGFLKEQTIVIEKEIKPVEYHIIQPPDDVSSGNEVVGQELFNKSCLICHGRNGVGTVQGPGLERIQLSDSVIAKRLRLSGPEEDPVYNELEGGKMPFWSQERLSDDEMRNIISFLQSQSALKRKTSEPPVPQTERVDLSLSESQKNCGKTSQYIGKKMTLRKRFHEVSGTITIIDDCTLHFDQFFYDGLGVDVRVYAGKNNDFDNGLTISQNILGRTFQGGKASLRLPEGMNLTDFNSLSIWCVPIGISFGEGVFM
ncbi:MAG: DM13 domain-containing protein [Oligoflexales bacterium]